MKRLLPLALSMVALCACSNPQQPSAGNESSSTADSTIATIQIPKSACYMNVSGKDTLQLKLEVFPNVVTGVLRYDFSEKDKSEGNFDGKLHGDTVIADYTFMSEGASSTRQIAFLIKDSAAVEGYGEMEEKDGKLIFKQTQNIDFSKGTIYKMVSCLEYDPANKTMPVAQASSGSEALYQYQWNLIELQGQQTIQSQDKPAHLVFTPGEVGAVAGSTGCNRLRGTFKLSGTSAISFSPLITTKMACPDNSVETSFLKALAEVDAWAIANNESLLKKGNSVLAKLTGTKAKS